MAERLKLELPAKSDYLLPIRLFVSGIATRLEYNMSDIEDIRVCVSEACALLLRGIQTGMLHMDIDAAEKLTVEIAVKDGAWQEEQEDDELPRMILEAMAGEFAAKETDGRVTEIHMSFDK